MSILFTLNKEEEDIGYEETYSLESVCNADDAIQDDNQIGKK